MNLIFDTIMPMKKKITTTETFGQRLRNARRAKGLTQEKLSKMTGISRRAITHYECYGKRPPIDTLKKLSEAMGVSVDRLIGIDAVQNTSDDISFSLMKRFQIVEKLPLRDQKAVFRFINSLVEKNKTKGKK